MNPTEQPTGESTPPAPQFTSIPLRREEAVQLVRAVEHVLSDEDNEAFTSENRSSLRWAKEALNAYAHRPEQASVHTGQEGLIRGQPHAKDEGYAEEFPTGHVFAVGSPSPAHVVLPPRFDVARHDTLSLARMIYTQHFGATVAEAVEQAIDFHEKAEILYDAFMEQQAAITEEAAKRQEQAQG